jgi:[ribosomal protein S18]-alanine N-acetyltransferase
MNISSGCTITIQKAEPQHLDELHNLELDSFDGDRISRRNYRRLLRVPSACCLVALENNQLIGSLVLLFRRNSPKARIYSLAVASSARGKGIGKKLIHHAETEAAQRGCHSLTLEVRCDNLAAITLYTRMNYTKTADLIAYYEDGANGLRFTKEIIDLS